VEQTLAINSNLLRTSGRGSGWSLNFVNNSSPASSAQCATVDPIFRAVEDEVLQPAPAIWTVCEYCSAF